MWWRSWPAFGRVHALIIGKQPIVVVVFAIHFLDGFFFAGAGYAEDASAAELSITAAQRKRLRAGLLIQDRLLVSGLCVFGILVLVAK